MFGKFFDEISKPSQAIVRAAAKQAERQLTAAVTAETQALVDEAMRRAMSSLTAQQAQPAGFMTATPSSSAVIG